MAKEALNEEKLEGVAGGFIDYQLNTETNKALLWINQADDPEAANQKYLTNDFTAFKAFFDKNYAKYGDYMILEKAAAAGLCTLVTE